MRKLLVFHKAIAPYRIDFFNDLYDSFETKIVLDHRNLKDQTFNYNEIEKKLHFSPEYLTKWFSTGKRDFYKGYLKELRNSDPDVVFCGEYGLSLWAAVFARLFRRRKYKIITICDDSESIAVNCSGARRISRNLAMNFLDGIILCNPQAEKWYNEHFRVKTFCFPIIHKDEVFRKALGDALPLAQKELEELGLIGKKVFLFVGRLAPVKNLEYLVRSFVAASKDHPEIRLLIVGDDGDTDGTVRKNILSILEKENCSNVLLLGRREGEALASAYNLGQVLVLTSTSEAFGAVTNEALLSGELVMISKYAGSSCLVNGDNGEIIDIDRPAVDFSDMLSKIRPLTEKLEIRPSRMPISYGEKMAGLKDWINNL